MIDFPNSPVDGAQFTSGNSSWVWNAAASQWRTALIPNAVLDNTVTAAKLTSTAITDKLGYTPVNKAGDTFTGNVSISNGANGKLSMGNATYYGSVEHDASVTGANIYNVAAASGGGHKFRVGNTEIIEIHKNGGIKFPAAQLSNSDVNTLDDYEEGTWSPTLSGSGVGSYTMTGVTSGRYIKIGKMVWLTCSLQWSGVNTPYTGNLIVSNTPFPVASSATRSAGCIGAVSSGLSFSAGYGEWQLVADPSYAFFYIIQNSAAGSGYSHQPIVGSSGIVYALSICYEAA